MNTILIVEDNIKDAKSAVNTLKKIFGEDYNIEVLGCTNLSNACISEHNNYYNENLIGKLNDKIESCKNDEKPVIGIVLDIFLTDKEEISYALGNNYIANTSSNILKTLGSVDKNGSFKALNNKKNFIIISRFPQYKYYAQDVSGNEEWAKYYISKVDFFDYGVNEDDAELGKNIKEVLSGKIDNDDDGGMEYAQQNR